MAEDGRYILNYANYFVYAVKKAKVVSYKKNFDRHVGEKIMQK
jgi:hypothetical protein